MEKEALSKWGMLRLNLVPGDFWRIRGKQADAPFTRERFIGDAALRLIHTQNNDGGWEWNNPDTTPSTGVPSPANTIGVTAQGMLDAYCKLGYRSFMQVCTHAYNLMVTNSASPDPSKHRIRGPDITFLALLSQVLADQQYSSFARTRWQSAKTEFGAGTATGFARYIRDIRKSQHLPAIISWDINLYVQGLLALQEADPGGEYEAEAKDMAEVIYSSLYVTPVDFDMNGHNQSEYWLGITGALEAFVTTGLYPRLVQDLTDALENGQQLDGHWIGVGDGSDNQTTAYAVMALLKAAREAPVELAINCLMTKQLDKGGFEYDTGTENTEVTSEVIQAFYHSQN